VNDAVEEQPLPPYGTNTELSNQDWLSSGTEDLDYMKKIGFLSFGHWTPSPQSQARSAADVLLQSIDLAPSITVVTSPFQFHSLPAKPLFTGEPCGMHSQPTLRWCDLDVLL
jgi:hypothetical protein